MEVSKNGSEQWIPTAEDLAVIEQLEASRRPVDQAYAKAYRQGLFVREFGDEEIGSCIAAVGELNALAEIEREIGKEIIIKELSIGDCLRLGLPPSGGATRAECVLNGITEALERRTSSSIGFM